MSFQSLIISSVAAVMILSFVSWIGCKSNTEIDAAEFLVKPFYPIEYLNKGKLQEYGFESARGGHIVEYCKKDTLITIGFREYGFNYYNVNIACLLGSVSDTIKAFKLKFPELEFICENGHQILVKHPNGVFFKFSYQLNGDIVFANFAYEYPLTNTDYQRKVREQRAPKIIGYGSG